MRTYLMAATAALSVFGGAAFADTIDPTSFTADLAVGESVTVRKTVVISKGAPTTAPLDVMFLFDTTGSMGAAIGAAKTASANIIADLGAFGPTRTGVAYYDDVLGEYSTSGTGSCGTTECGIISNLSGTAATTIAGINTLAASGGGDFAEEGNMGVLDVVNNASWLPDSNRFIIVLGDSSFKAPPTSATVKTALEAAGVKLIGIDYGGSSTAFDDAIAALGGTVVAGTGSGTGVAADIIASVTSAFATYSKVSVTDFGVGLPEIGVTTVCVSADDGACIGAEAVGAFNRSKDRTFEFDVTFKRLAEGDSAFDTFATTDGLRVAREADRFPDDVSEVPLPAGAWLLLAGLGGLAAMRRRKAA